jgi:F0F1-type ATP synthase assembly protein I
MFFAVWGAVGGFFHFMIKSFIRDLEKLVPKDAHEAKMINEQLKLISNFLNTIGIGIIGITILNNIKETSNLFVIETIIFLIIGLIFHYNALKMLSFWKPEK